MEPRYYEFNKIPIDEDEARNMKRVIESLNKKRGFELFVIKYFPRGITREEANYIMAHEQSYLCNMLGINWR